MMYDIPEYYAKFVVPGVDLRVDPKQPCPFHHEQSGKSFSYSIEKDYFSCFGACKCFGGDVVKMHMLHRGIKSRGEGERSYKILCGVNPDVVKLDLRKREVQVNEDEVTYRATYAEAVRKATTPERWLELDYILSQYPTRTADLEVLLNKWRSVK